MSNREFLTDLQRRKVAREGLCESCDGRGGEGGRICSDCLGQGVLLTGEEYAILLRIAGWTPADLDDDSILDQQEFE